MDDDKQRFDSVRDELFALLNDCAADVRVTAEYKAAAASLQRLSAEPGEFEDAARELEAQRDMVALTREQKEQERRQDELSKQRRLAEDRALLLSVEDELGTYKLLLGASLLLAPILGVPLGQFVLLAVVPGALGVLRMRAARQPLRGRSWLVLNDEVRRVTDAVRTFDLAAGVALAPAIIWFAVLVAR